MKNVKEQVSRSLYITVWEELHSQIRKKEYEAIWLRVFGRVSARVYSQVLRHIQESL